MTAQDRTSTYAWRKLRARVLAASDVCHLCGRSGADEVDHIVPVARGGAPLEEANARPAHGACNRRKGARFVMPPWPTVAPPYTPSREW